MNRKNDRNLTCIKFLARISDLSSNHFVLLGVNNAHSTSRRENNPEMALNESINPSPLSRKLKIFNVHLHHRTRTTVVVRRTVNSRLRKTERHASTLIVECAARPLAICQRREVPFRTNRAA